MLGPEALRIPPHEDHILHTVINESLADDGSAPPTGAIPPSHESPESMVSNPTTSKESSSLEPQRPQQSSATEMPAAAVRERRLTPSWRRTTAMSLLRTF